MKIAMLGTRGIPAAYSGFETAVENLSREFAARGHDVVVYCRPHMTERREHHAGARLVHLPTVRNKYLDTMVHTFVSTAHAVTRDRPDVALYFISGNAPVVPLAGLARVPTVFQIDGLDSARAKWPAPARAFIRGCERLAPAVADITITDSQHVADALEERYGRRIPAVPYGASLPDPGDSGLCARLGVTPGRFTLFVGRLVPENNAHLLINAHRRAATGWPLVIVGDAPYAEGYVRELHAAGEDADVIFTGYMFGDGYAELVHRCGVMCAPTEVGGTHPVIIEGMAAGACMLVSDHAPNVEATAGTAATFPIADGAAGLARELTALAVDDERRRRLGEAAARVAGERYSWATCAERYLTVLRAARTRRTAGRR